MFQEVFAGEFARSALPRMLELARRWRPDVIVRETLRVRVAAGRRRDRRAGRPRRRASSAALRRLRARPRGARRLRARVRPARRQGDRADEPYLTLAPRALEDPRLPRDARDAPLPRAAAPARPLPDWWNGSAAPLVYVSFGSAAAGNGFFPDVYREAADALGDAPVRVLLTLGTEVDPADLGPVPANVHVEPWVPQGAVMAHAAAMVGHGGSGSTLAAMAAGMPLAVVPLFADQPENAAPRRRRSAPGCALDGVAGLADAVDRAARDPFYRAQRARGRRRDRALPPVDDVVDLLERSPADEPLAA